MTGRDVTFGCCHRIPLSIYSQDNFENMDEEWIEYRLQTLLNKPFIIEVLQEFSFEKLFRRQADSAT